MNDDDAIVVNIVIGSEVLMSSDHNTADFHK